MSRPASAEVSPLTAESSEANPDPELASLPVPRRRGRRLTLLSMGLTALVSIFMVIGLRGEVVYALRSGPPQDLGDLAAFVPSTGLHNRWVHGRGSLSTAMVVRFSRPLDSDSYQLAPVANNPRLWVQIRVPSGLPAPIFIPPSSLVGRLLEVKNAGLRYRGVARAIADSGAGKLPADAWLLVDGEAPGTTRWAAGLACVFMLFAGFNVYGLLRLFRPIY